MWKKLKIFAFKCVLSILCIFSECMYRIFIKMSWIVEELQFKKGFKDRGVQKYTNEDLIFFALFIPDGTKLSGPEVRKYYSNSNLSKEYIYKIIEMRRYANTHKPEYINFVRSEYLRKLYPKIYW